MTVRHLSEEELTSRFGTPDERLARHRRGDRSLKFISSQISHWRELHPGKIVLVFDGRLVGVARDLDDLDKVLCGLTVPRDEVLTWHIRTGDSILVPSLFRAAD